MAILFYLFLFSITTTTIAFSVDNLKSKTRTLQPLPAKSNTLWATKMSQHVPLSLDCLQACPPGTMGTCILPIHQQPTRFFYRCIEGQPSVGSCTPGMIYTPEQNRCLPLMMPSVVPGQSFLQPQPQPQQLIATQKQMGLDNLAAVATEASGMSAAPEFSEPKVPPPLESKLNPESESSPEVKTSMPFMFPAATTDTDEEDDDDDDEDDGPDTFDNDEGRMESLAHKMQGFQELLNIALKKLDRLEGKMIGAEEDLNKMNHMVEQAWHEASSLCTNGARIDFGNKKPDLQSMIDQKVFEDFDVEDSLKPSGKRPFHPAFQSKIDFADSAAKGEQEAQQQPQQTSQETQVQTPTAISTAAPVAQAPTQVTSTKPVPTATTPSVQPVTQQQQAPQQQQSQVVPEARITEEAQTPTAAVAAKQVAASSLSPKESSAKVRLEENQSIQRILDQMKSKRKRKHRRQSVRSRMVEQIV